jgi:hypothetical protein
MALRAPWILPALAWLLLAAACGGGGDAGTPSAGPYAADDGLRRLLVTGGRWDLSGSAAGQPFTMTIALAPTASGPFPVTGIPAARSLQTVSVTTGGQTSTSTETIYYAPQTNAVIGLEADGTCSVATSNTPVPATAPMGAGGPIFAETDLDGCLAGSNSLGTTANTWSLEMDSGVSLLCWNMAAKDPAGAPAGNASTCFEIAVDGTLGARARFTVAAGGLSLSARNF